MHGLHVQQICIKFIHQHNFQALKTMRLIRAVLFAGCCVTKLATATESRTSTEPCAHSANWPFGRYRDVAGQFISMHFTACGSMCIQCTSHSTGVSAQWVRYEMYMCMQYIKTISYQINTHRTGQNLFAVHGQRKQYVLGGGYKQE